MSFRAVVLATAQVMLRGLSITGIRTQTFAYFENWRRPADCICRGCGNWHRVEAGETTVEELGQAKLQCVHRILAWTDGSPIGAARWNSLMACLWIAILAVCSVNMFASIGLVGIVTTVGKNDILSKYFQGSAYTAAWFIALVDGGSAPTFVVADTMGVHSGWTENVSYSNATRPAWTGGVAGGGSIDNTASPAVFNINATATVAGQFIINNSTKSGATGQLYSEANFIQGNRSVINGDTITSTATMQVA